MYNIVPRELPNSYVFNCVNVEANNFIALKVKTPTSSCQRTRKVMPTHRAQWHYTERKRELELKLGNGLEIDFSDN